MFKVQLLVRGEWVQIGLIFSSNKEAEQHAAGLADQWTAVQDWRVIANGYESEIKRAS